MQDCALAANLELVSWRCSVSGHVARALSCKWQGRLSGTTPSCSTGLALSWRVSTNLPDSVPKCVPAPKDRRCPSEYSNAAATDYFPWEHCTRVCTCKQSVNSNRQDMAGFQEAAYPLPKVSITFTKHARLVCVSQGVSLSSAFINYRPCIVVNSPNWVNISPTGIVLQPDGEFHQFIQLQAIMA